jgi:hypothetical protein
MRGRSATGNDCLNPVTGFPAPLRILCHLTSGNRRTRRFVVLVMKEGVPATIVFRHYRAPGRRGNWRGDYLLAFAMTERRLLVYGATPDRRPPSPFVNVSWEQAKAGGLRALLDDGSLQLCFEFSALYPDRAGQAEVWLRTEHAPAALASADAKLS